MEPKLRQRPVAVAVMRAARSLVVAASVEARQAGVWRGMPLAQAQKNCPDLWVLPPNEPLYERATHAFLKVIGGYTPVYEPLRFGHVYMDMTGVIRLFGGVKDAALKTQRDIAEQLRLDASAGVAANKLVSKVAATVIVDAGEQTGLCDVRRGDEKPFLAPLRVGYLPGVGKTVHGDLRDLNVQRIGELADIHTEHLQRVFGRFGQVLWQRANGIDPRPVRPPQRAPEIAEQFTFETDSNDADALLAQLHGMLAAATLRLRQQELPARQLVVHVHYSDGKDNRAQTRFSPCNTDVELTPILNDIFENALNRRIRVRRLTLRLRDLQPHSEQLSLFDTADARTTALTAAMDTIRHRFGAGAIRFGRAA